MQNQTIDLSGLGRLDDLSIGLKPSLLMRRLRDERGEPFTPDGWQVEYLDSTDPAVLLLAYRQSGKTTGTAVRALHTCLFEPGRLVLIISPTDRQSGIVLDRVKGFYRQLGGSLGETARETEHRVRFGNGAEVVSLPGIADAIRGYSSVRLLIIEEAARVPNEVYAAVMPMVAEDGQTLCTTTPRGRAGWFAREWHEGEGWRRIEVPAEVASRMSQAALRAKKAKLTPHEYAREYGLSFGGDDDALYPPDLIADMMDPSVEVLPVGWPRFGAGR